MCNTFYNNKKKERKFFFNLNLKHCYPKQNQNFQGYKYCKDLLNCLSLEWSFIQGNLKYLRNWSILPPPS